MAYGVKINICNYNNKNHNNYYLLLLLFFYLVSFLNLTKNLIYNKLLKTDLLLFMKISLNLHNSQLSLPCFKHFFPVHLLQALKTYHQYHIDCLAAEGKLKEATRLEEKQTGKSADLGLSQSGGQRRSSVKKMERLMEKVKAVVCENERL